MNLLTISSIIVTICALFGYINHRFFGLPTTIGIMVQALALSAVILLLPHVGINVVPHARAVLEQIDFSATLLEGMLSFLLFAGALHVKLEHLRAQKWAVSLLAGFGTMFSAASMGTIAYYLLAWAGFPIPWIFALLFGALIAPTDPVAVMAILKKAGVSKSLETKVVGESLFNDGIAVVIFLALLHILEGQAPSAAGISILFAQEAIGGMVLGFVLGGICYRLLASIDNYQVEILLTLALVMGGYQLALWWHLSGPIMVVIAGLLIGNHGRTYAMTERTRENLDHFWELCDEFLNAALFLLIGLEILVLHGGFNLYILGLVMIPLALAVRYVAVLLPITFMSKWRVFERGTVPLLTWGGLRGGISVALALSLPPSPERDIILIVTYCIVLFSILVQGLTIGKLVKHYAK